MKKLLQWQIYYKLLICFIWGFCAVVVVPFAALYTAVQLTYEGWVGVLQGLKQFYDEN
jgi:hypothetical protein